MKKVYLSGPMTGLPSFNKEAFEYAESKWTLAGWTVVSPLHNQHIFDTAGEQNAYKLVMRKDLFDLLGCEAIALLPDWENSIGARAELVAAMACKMSVYDAFTLKESNAGIEFYFTYKTKNNE